MRMGCSFFIGLIFVFAGFEILLKYFFHVSVPLFRILVALIFIYIGVSIFIGKDIFKSFEIICADNREVFGSYNSVYKDRESENAVESIAFGEKKIDLRGVKIKGAKLQLKADCAFGNMEIFIDKETQVKITANSAFGSVVMPESNMIVFGTKTYESPGFNPGKPYIEISASAAFGQIVFK